MAFTRCLVTVHTAGIEEPPEYSGGNVPTPEVANSTHLRLHIEFLFQNKIKIRPSCTGHDLDIPLRYSS